MLSPPSPRDDLKRAPPKVLPRPRARPVRLRSQPYRLMTQSRTNQWRPCSVEALLLTVAAPCPCSSRRHVHASRPSRGGGGLMRHGFLAALIPRSVHVRGTATYHAGLSWGGMCRPWRAATRPSALDAPHGPRPGRFRVRRSPHCSPLAGVPEPCCRQRRGRAGGGGGGGGGSQAQGASCVLQAVRIRDNEHNVTVLLQAQYLSTNLAWSKDLYHPPSSLTLLMCLDCSYSVFCMCACLRRAKRPRKQSRTPLGLTHSS